MKVVNMGAINRGLIFKVPSFQAAAETIGERNVQSRLGGKGLDQPVRIARADGSVISAFALTPIPDAPFLQALEQTDTSDWTQSMFSRSLQKWTTSPKNAALKVEALQ
ncbi:MAG: hypothetical protein ABJN14_20180 [Paracoccaceae bacterium]